MQVARNFYLSTEKTFTRKIYEILLTLKIESLLTKDQILELYMNQIFLGQRAYGFAAASEIYFGKPLKDITHRRGRDAGRPAEGAVGLQPDRQPEARHGAPAATSSTACSRTASSPQEQHDAAREQTLRYRAPSEVPVHAEYVAETARQLVFAQYGDEAYTRGLNVYLTIDSADQEVAYRALRRGMLDFEQRQVYRGPEAYVDLPADPKRGRRAHRRGAGRAPRQRRAARRGRARGVADARWWRCCRPARRSRSPATA